MLKTEAAWIAAYKAKGGLWIHDDHPARPHALLTSGKHSNGFFNSRKIIPDRELLSEAGQQLTEKLAATIDFEQLRRISVVVGPQTGATLLSELMAEALAVLTGQDVAWASPAKSENGINAMLFGVEDIPLIRGATVLMCEDVISTGKSIGLAEQALRDCNAVLLPYVCALVNRSGESIINGKEVISLINRNLPMWLPEECPLCQKDSEAIPAKEPANWTRLTEDY